MNYSIILLQLILVAQICIYFSSPLMIDPVRIKEPGTPDLLPDAISVASENSVSTLTTPYNSLDLLTSDDPNTLHVMNKDVPFKGRVNRIYCCRKHSQIICYKKTSFYRSTCSDKKNKFYCCRGFSRISSETRTCFLEHQHSMSQCFG